jgi:hypothetical protein
MNQVLDLLTELAQFGAAAAGCYTAVVLGRRARRRAARPQDETGPAGEAGEP